MLVIGIAGGTGSGKTTVVNNLLNRIDANQVNTLGQDNYYFDNSSLLIEERNKLNYDHPHSIDFNLLIDHVKKLKEGKSIKQPIYSFHTHTRKNNILIINPKKILLVEGILVLSNSKLREEFDVKIFVSTDSDERLIRRIRRDIQERGRALEEVLQRYQSTLKPMHEQFIEPSKSYADIIIPNMKQNPVAVDILTSIINNFLKKS